MQFIQHYDLRRDKNFVETFPEFQGLYEEWYDENENLLATDFNYFNETHRK